MFTLINVNKHKFSMTLLILEKWNVKFSLFSNILLEKGNPKKDKNKCPK